MQAAENNYGIRNLELLALVEGEKHYNFYLAGRNFKVVYDHQTKTQETWWAIFLQSYNFEMIYKKGTSNGNANALSRRQYEPEPKTLYC